MNYAYIRVSTGKQEYERQFYALKDCNVPKENIFCETISGTKKTQTRPEFERMVSQLNKGDVVYFESMSRMSRSVIDMVETAERLVKKHNITIKFIKEGIELGGETNSTSNFMFNIFASIAQLERDLISERTKMAIAAKRALLGDKFKIGRDTIYDQDIVYQVIDMRAECMTIMEISEVLGISKSTIGRISKSIKETKEELRNVQKSKKTA